MSGFVCRKEQNQTQVTLCFIDIEQPANMFVALIDY